MANLIRQLKLHFLKAFAQRECYIYCVSPLACIVPPNSNLLAMRESNYSELQRIIISIVDLSLPIYMCTVNTPRITCVQLSTCTHPPIYIQNAHINAQESALINRHTDNSLSLINRISVYWAQCEHRHEFVHKTL